MKALNTPPGGIPEVMYACMYLLANYFDVIDMDKNKKPKTLSWNEAKKLMASPQKFLDALLGFQEVVDANKVVDNNVTIVKNTYIADSEFTPEKLESKSAAAKGLCAWVINIV